MHYLGIIIEHSLADRSILDEINILAARRKQPWLYLNCNGYGCRYTTDKLAFGCTGF
jgi:hypothetical protein